jgi:predicted nucleic acid-binding protein
VAFDAAFDATAFEMIAPMGPVGPPLLWSETTAALRRAAFRGAITDEAAEGLARLRSSAIERRSPRRLYEEAWALAARLVWAKPYDAEYVALARLLCSPLLTKDGRLNRRSARLAQIIGIKQP